MVFAQAAVWQVQHGAPLEGLQAGRGNEAGDGHRLFHELTDDAEKTTCLYTQRTVTLRGEPSLIFSNAHFLLERGPPEC